MPLLAGLTVANWLVAQWFGAWRARWIPLFGVALNLAVLGLFKYADFFRGTVFGLLGQHWQPWDLILPLGISFFVFQKISYLIDLRRGDRHIYGFLDFCMFVMFFPQLIAGPLVRHNEIIHQFELDPRRAEKWENLSRGFILFLIGVAKKVAFADTLAMVADPLFAKAVRHPPERRRGMDRGRRLHAADLLRLLRLFRHGDRPRPDVRPAPAVQLQRAVPRAVDARLLAALAHDAVPLPARLPLHPAGRQPLRTAAPGSQRHRHHAARRPVARRELDLRRVGRAARRRARGEPCVGGTRRPPAARLWPGC